MAIITTYGWFDITSSANTSSRGFELYRDKDILNKIQETFGLIDGIKIKEHRYLFCTQKKE